MKIKKSYVKNNPCYKEGKKIQVKGLMLHSVGMAQPNAGNFIETFNDSSYNRACVHAFIDANDGVVYQTLPWNYRGWHSGGSANNTHIGVEMCEPATIKYTSGTTIKCTDKEDAQKAVKRTYKSAVSLFAKLCLDYSLNPLGKGVIVSHHEGYSKGIATNHADPEHLWSGVGVDYSMSKFRKAVKKKLDALKEEKTKNAPKSMTNKDCPFVVTVTNPELKIRTGAGTNYEYTGENPGDGKFTIVEVKSGQGSEAGWGKLKSGAGWIGLCYCVRVE